MFARPPQSHQSPHSKNDKILNSHLKNKNKKTVWLFVVSQSLQLLHREQHSDIREAVYPPACLPACLPALLLLKTQHEEKVRHLIHNGWFVYEPTNQLRTPPPPKNVLLFIISASSLFIYFFYFCLPQARSTEPDPAFFSKPNVWNTKKKIEKKEKKNKKLKK